MVRKKLNVLFAIIMGGCMKTRYNINDNSYVIVEYKNGSYYAQHFRNGCSRGLASKASAKEETILMWIEKVKAVFNV